MSSLELEVSNVVERAVRFAVVSSSVLAMPLSFINANSHLLYDLPPLALSVLKLPLARAVSLSHAQRMRI